MRELLQIRFFKAHFSLQEKVSLFFLFIFFSYKYLLIRLVILFLFGIAILVSSGDLVLLLNNLHLCDDKFSQYNVKVN